MVFSSAPDPSSTSHFVRFRSTSSATIANRLLFPAPPCNCRLRDSTVAPAHLDGTLPGDFGFDPLGLGADPERLKYYVEAEKMNARWAMAAVTDIVTTEVLGIGGPWYEAGQGEYDLPIPALLAVQFPVMGILELKRMRGFLATGKSGVNESFPWDPMGMNNDAYGAQGDQERSPP